MKPATFRAITALVPTIVLALTVLGPGCAEGDISQMPGGQSTTSTAAAGHNPQGGGGQGTTSTAGGTGGSSPEGGTGGSIEQGGAPPADPCTGAADGAHCGGELGGLADHSSLYHCAGGSTQSVTPCPQGCANGACQQPPADPCLNANAGNGPYCGASLGAGDPDTLYQCVNQATQSSTVCSNGCHVQPPGQPDNCNPTGDPCVNASSGNGPYCGASLGSGDPNTLYQCVNQATQSSTVCANGCHEAPPAQPDYCEPSSGGDCCLNEPPGWITQLYTACGNGGSHYGIDYGTAVGTPIYAGMAGTVVGSALGYPNCYDNGCSQSCWNSFNYVKLRTDCGDPNVGGHDLFVYYLHIDDLGPGISNGAHVDQGQLLAYSGNSGCSSGPHIHLETVSVPSGNSVTLSTCNSVDPSTRYCP